MSCISFARGDWIGDLLSSSGNVRASVHSFPVPAQFMQQATRLQMHQTLKHDAERRTQKKIPKYIQMHQPLKHDAERRIK